MKHHLHTVQSGCCALVEKKTFHKKSNNSPYHYRIKIEDIHCQNCCNKIENTLNALEFLQAKVNLETKIIDLNSSSSLITNEIEALIECTGHHHFLLIQSV